MNVRTAAPSHVHRIVAVSVAAVLALAGVLVAMPAHAAETRTIGGTFTVPAAGIESWWAETVSISAYKANGDWAGSVAVDTDAKTFSLTGLEPGQYRLQFGTSWVDHDGDDYWESANLVGQDGNTSTVVDVTSADATSIAYAYAAGKTVSGTVTLGAGANPSWANSLEASVDIPGPEGCNCGDSFSTKVNPVTGAYVIRGLPDKFLTIRFGPKYGGGINLVPEYWNDSYGWASATKLDFATGSKSNIDAELEVGKTISGTVNLPGGVSSDALKGIDVLAEGTFQNYYQVDIDPVTGAYSLVGLAPDTYTLRFSAGDWYDSSDNRVFTTLASVYLGGGYTASGSTTVNVDSANATGKNVTMAVGRTISGSVTLGSGVDPKWGTVLRAYAEGTGDANNVYRSAEVNPTTGAYTLRGLTPGSYTVQFDATSLWNGSDWEYDDFAWEYYNNKRSPVAANLVNVATANATGINAVMDQQVGNREFWTTPVPIVSGATTVGSVLTATPGTWEPYASTFTYQWKRGGVNIAGATAKTYTLVAADRGTNITVAVTGSTPGYTAVTKTSAATAVPLAAFTTAPTPTITGTAAAGQLLTAVPGTWSPAASFSYQWLRNGSPISGATSSTYTVTQADAVQSLSVTVTGSATGYTATPRTSAGVAVGASPFTTVANPTIAGTAAAGSLLTAVPGTWSPAATFGYQWLRNGSPISGATSSTYTVTQADAIQNLSVTVTGSATGYTPTAKTSSTVAVAATPFTTAPGVVVDGVREVGNTVSASVDPWDPAATFTYVWLRNGDAISGATNSDYTLVEADGGQYISVRVTGSATGYLTTTRLSGAFVPTGHFFSDKPAPTISGTPQVGKALTAAITDWTPVSDFGIEWLRDGEPIDDANGLTYTLTAADLDHDVSVRITGHLDGYEREQVPSETVTVTAGAFTTTPTPAISGSTYLGATLTAKAGTWAPVASGLSYQWYRNGAAISGAKAATYKLTSSDAGKKIAVKVTGSRSGYVSVAKTSSAVTIAKYFTKIGTASVTGTVKVGYTVTASRGTWSPAPTSYSYQWYANGVAISGATKSTYAIGPSSAGKALSVKVTGKRSGYASQPKTSAAKTVAYATFKTAPTPKITGTVKVGYTLTAARGTWSPAATSYSYQWYRSGSVISGATSYKYKLTSSDKGKTITVKVTAKKTGYSSASKTSAKTSAVK